MSVFVGICHCTNCQKQSGAAYSVNVGILKSALTLQGILKTFTDHGDSGREVLRKFCSNCGSPILRGAEAFPSIHILKAGTPDTPSAVKPQRQIFCSSKHPWVPILEGIPAYNRGVLPAT